MELSRQRVWTIAEFQAFVTLPEHNERLFELINGEIVEKMPGRTSNAFLAMKLDRKVYPFSVNHGMKNPIPKSPPHCIPQGRFAVELSMKPTTPQRDENGAAGL
jgi:hypothetical protein